MKPVAHRKFDTDIILVWTSIIIGALIVIGLIAFDIYCWCTYAHLPWEEIPGWCKWVFFWK